MWFQDSEANHYQSDNHIIRIDHHSHIQYISGLDLWVAKRHKIVLEAITEEDLIR